MRIKGCKRFIGNISEGPPKDLCLDYFNIKIKKRSTKCRIFLRRKDKKAHQISVKMVKSWKLKKIFKEGINNLFLNNKVNAKYSKFKGKYVIVKRTREEEEEEEEEEKEGKKLNMDEIFEKIANRPPKKKIKRSVVKRKRKRKKKKKEEEKFISGDDAIKKLELEYERCNGNKYKFLESMCKKNKEGGFVNVKKEEIESMSILERTKPHFIFIDRL